MRYYLHIPLPENLRNMVWALEREFGVQGRSEPHITVIPPREIIEGRSEHELIDAIGPATRNLNACMIIEKEVGYFNDTKGNKETIHIDLARTPNLLALHEGLVKAVNGILKPADGDFVNMPNPHITLVTKLLPELMEGAWKVLEGGRFFGWFPGDAIALLRKGNDDMHRAHWHWEAVRRFGL